MYRWKGIVVNRAIREHHHLRQSSHCHTIHIRYRTAQSIIQNAHKVTEQEKVYKNHEI